MPTLSTACDHTLVEGGEGAMGAELDARADWIAEALAVDGVEGARAAERVADAIASQWRNIAGRAEPVDIDFRPLEGIRHRVSPKWGAVVANLLAGTFADVPLRVTLPEAEPAQRQLARSCLYFALARHNGLDWQHLRDGADHGLAEWRHDWEPTDVQQPLFEFDGAQEGDDVPRRLEQQVLAFLNPNRKPRVAAAEDQNAVVYQWLRTLMAESTRDVRTWRERLFRELSLANYELLDNVREHAQLRHDTGLCSIQVFTTEGSGQDRNRLYFSVFDNGVGIPATIADRFDAPLDAKQMVEAPFNGELPRRERDRGRGLHRIAEIANLYDGNLFVATGPADSGAMVIDHKGGSGKRVSAKFVPKLAVRGTVVVLTLPLKSPLKP